MSPSQYVEVSFDAYYRCRDDRGRFLPTRVEHFIFYPSGILTDDEIQTAAFDYAEQHAPENCTSTAIGTPTITRDLGPSGPTGQILSVRAYAWYDCVQGPKPLEFVDNFPDTVTREELDAIIRAWADDVIDAMVGGHGSDWGDCSGAVFSHIEYIGPLYWELSTGI